MTIHSPLIITARLLPGARLGGAFISIEYAETTSGGRTRYRYFIDLPDGTEHSADDLCSGVGGGSLQRGLEDLLCFLEDSDQELFPRKVCDWAYQHRDELGMLRLHLEENKKLIEE